jgi:integrase
MSLNRFIENCYLPYVEEQKRRSTYCGYKNIWLRYVQPNGDVALRDVRTYEAEQMLKNIARREDLRRTTLGHIKHFLSGAFRYARRQGVLESPNPIHDVEIPRARPAGDTYAYSLEEEFQMLAILPEPAATVVAVAAFTGTRKGEIRGFSWENYDGSEIRVEKSVWRSYVDEPKRPKSKGAIPVISQLKIRLDEHWERSGRPSKGFIFSNELGDPMNLEALAVDVVRPALEKNDLKWHGWHAFRRGLATNLHRLRVSDKVIQQVLRHANVSTTMNIYVKTVSADAANAMKSLETMCATSVQPERLGSTRIM